MTRDEHELMRLIRVRVEQKPPIPMTQIAIELGYDVDDLCAFIMAYKEPKNRRVNTSRYGPPIPVKAAPSDTVGHWNQDADRQRMNNWRKQREGAAAAREALGG